MNNRLISIVALSLSLYSTSSHSLTNLDLMGEYIVTGINIQYPGFVAITHNDLSSYRGRLTISKTGIVGEVEGIYQGVRYWEWSCGFYTISGNILTASIVGEGSSRLSVQLSGNTLKISGSTTDEFGDFYNYIYTFKKLEKLYTQFQYDQAVNSATSGLYTQTQLDQAVRQATSGLYTQQQLDNAVAAIKPRVVVIPIGE